MANCLPKELNKQEQRIVNDLMQRSNLNLEDATTIARTMIGWGYTKHEQDYNRLKIALDIIKGNIVSKKRIQSLRETANPIYEVVLHIPQKVLKGVLDNDR